MKVKWKVDEAPTGPYRSFQKRGWPHAYYENGEMAAAIYCDDGYCPRDVKEGKHSPLTLRIADHSVLPSWKWKTAKTKCATLREAKELFVKILKQNPSIAPKTSEEQK